MSGNPSLFNSVDLQSFEQSISAAESYLRTAPPPPRVPAATSSLGSSAAAVSVPVKRYPPPPAAAASPSRDVMLLPSPPPSASGLQPDDDRHYPQAVEYVCSEDEYEADSVDGDVGKAKTDTSVDDDDFEDDEEAAVTSSSSAAANRRPPAVAWSVDTGNEPGRTKPKSSASAYSARFQPRSDEQQQQHHQSSFSVYPSSSSSSSSSQVSPPQPPPAVAVSSWGGPPTTPGSDVLTGVLVARVQAKAFAASERRAEQERRRQARECTFKPKVNKRKGEGGGGGGGSSSVSRPAPSSDSSPPPPSGGSSGSPSIPPPSPPSPPAPSFVAPSVHERLSLLASAVALKAAHARRLAEEEEAVEHRRACTFRPEVTRRAHNVKDRRERELQGGGSSSNNNSSNNNNNNNNSRDERESRDFGNRLHKDADLRNVVRECTRYHLKEAEMKEYTFTPKIVVTKGAVAARGEPHVPIHKRVEEVVKKKIDTLNKLRESQEEPSFRPNIAKNSAALMKGDSKAAAAAAAPLLLQDEDSSQYELPSDPRETAHRLHSESARMVERGVARVEEAEKSFFETNTFRPTLCSGTSHYAQANASKFNKPFIERQNDHVAVHNQKKLEKEIAAENQYRGYFKPHIGDSERVLMKNRPEIIAESDEGRILRLAVTDRENILNNREARAAEMYKDLTFEPKINNVSKALAVEPVTIENLNTNPRGQAVKAKAAKEAHDKLKSECTFKPSIRPFRPPPSAQLAVEAADESAVNLRREKRELLSLSNVEDLTVQVSRYNAVKEEERAEKLRERELNELKECTFAPVTNSVRRKMEKSKATTSTINENSAPHSTPGAGKKGGGKGGAEGDTNQVVVRGLGRYLELKKMAVAKTLDQKDREDKAFSVKTYTRDKYPDGTTQIKEFRLTQGNTERLERVKREREAQLMRECSFRPDTIERRNRSIIADILDEV